MAKQIHPSAVIDPSAELADGVVVGALAVIEAGVKVGEGSDIGHHAVLHSGVTLGRENLVFPHAVVGGAPQDLKYAGQPTQLVIGDRNKIREFTTINRGTAEGGGATVVGNDNLFMAYAHVAHDCKVGDGVVLANSVALAGHCQVGDHVVIGGLTGLHQFSRVGMHAMVGGLSRISKDVPPFSTTNGLEEVKVYGINKVGLRRRGFSREEMAALEAAFRLMQDPQLNLSEALAQMEAVGSRTEHVQILIDFLKTSDRGVYR